MNSKNQHNTKTVHIMAKRFTDGKIWDEDWYLAMPIEYQLLWHYIHARCNHGGLWRPNYRVFNTLHECRVTPTETLRLFNAEYVNIRVLDNGKWFMEWFVFEQYGKELKATSNVHKSVIELLEKNGIDPTDYPGVRQGLGKTCPSLKDKDKDKDSIDKKVPHLFANSVVAEVEAFKKAFAEYAEGKYMCYDLDYYYMTCMNWSNSNKHRKSTLKSDWIATAANMMLRDTKDNNAKVDVSVVLPKGARKDIRSKMEGV